MKILLSACLLGTPCRYDGASKPIAGLAERLRGIEWIAVCPEQMGGLATPRTPAERVSDRVVTAAGVDVSAEYRRGAELALLTAQRECCAAALLKEKSPSCGHGQIYDGTFTRTLTVGDGVTAQYLAAAGIPVYGESQVGELLAYLQSLKSIN